MTSILIRTSIVSAAALMGVLNAHSASVSNLNSSLVGITTVDDKEHYNAGMASSKVISDHRQLCGLGGLSYDRELYAISSNHAKYINHLQKKINVLNIDTHYQQKLKGYENFTGNANPYFTGVEFTDRVIAAGYQNAIYGGSENIMQEEIYSKDGLVPSTISVAKDFAHGLLAAPYHMQSLMEPSRDLIGTSFNTYTPIQNNPANPKKGYSLVSAVSSTENGSKKSIEGLFTYPCEGTTETFTALYNESPSPVAGTRRDLRIDPIGQPIYINIPSANTIKVSNIKMLDVMRNEDVPTEILDYRNDPHKDTEYRLPKSKAFILPITDNIMSCKAGKYTNCGLHSNTQYQVSFDVLVDGKKLIKHSFKFKTGNSNR